MTPPERESSPTARRSGAQTSAATITLRDGRVYVTDDAKLTSRRLTFTGRLRVRDLSGDRLYEPREHSLPPGRVKSIQWREQ